MGCTGCQFQISTSGEVDPRNPGSSPGGCGKLDTWDWLKGLRPPDLIEGLSK